MFKSKVPFPPDSAHDCTIEAQGKGMWWWGVFGVGGNGGIMVVSYGGTILRGIPSIALQTAAFAKLTVCFWCRQLVICCNLSKRYADFFSVFQNNALLQGLCRNNYKVMVRYASLPRIQNEDKY